MQLLRDLVQLSQLHSARGSPRPPEVNNRREVIGRHVNAPLLEHREIVGVLGDAARHLDRESVSDDRIQDSHTKTTVAIGHLSFAFEGYGAH